MLRLPDSRDWLNAEIEQRLQQHSSDYWIEKLNAAGMACGRINHIKQAFEEPQVQHLQMLKKVTSERLGEQVLMGAAGHADSHPVHHCARNSEAR